MSKYEQLIARILTKNKINFQQEKSFNDLKNGILKFDFYLPNFNGTPVIIEVDGQQHFKIVKAFQQNQLSLNKQQGYDRRKNSYCLANNIKLYRLPYWDFDNNRIKNLSDIFLEKNLVKSKWHNTDLWEKYKKEYSIE